MNTRTKKFGTLLTAGLLSLGSLAYAFPIEIIDVNFGSNNAGLGGFTAIDGSGSWTEQSESYRYFEQAQGMTSATLMRQFTGGNALSTAAGNHYSFSSVIESTGAGGNNNNRLAMVLFAPTNDPEPLSSGTQGISLNLNRSGLMQINPGLNFFTGNATYAWNTEGGAPIGTSTFTLDATVAFTATDANISFTLTDSAATPFSHTLTHSFALTDLNLGEYFGAAARARSDQGGPPAPDFSMNVESFEIVHVIPEPSTLALLGIALGAMVMFRRRK